MFDLIKNLEPKEKAILYQALDRMQSESEILLADSHDSNTNHAQRLPMDWLVKNTKELKKKLFSECFPEDLQPLNYFLIEQKELTGDIAGIP